MKRTTLVFVLLLLFGTVFAADKADKERSKFLKSVEQNMRWQGFDDARVSVAGKAKDVLLVWIPTASPAGMRSLEAQCIEPMREQLRSAGFRTVELRNGSIRWAPEWKWDVSLRNWDDPVQ
jgi:hypothetical protein